MKTQSIIFLLLFVATIVTPKVYAVSAAMNESAASEHCQQMQMDNVSIKTPINKAQDASTNCCSDCNCSLISCSSQSTPAILNVNTLAVSYSSSITISTLQIDLPFSIQNLFKPPKIS